MKVGKIVDGYKTPPNPKDISLDGELVQLVPLKAEKHSLNLFEANIKDKEGNIYISADKKGIYKISFIDFRS